MTKKKPHYTVEFKAEAIKKIADNSGNVSQAARELKMPMQTGRTKPTKANLKEPNNITLSL